MLSALAAPVSGNTLVRRVCVLFSALMNAGSKILFLCISYSNLLCDLCDMAVIVSMCWHTVHCASVEHAEHVVMGSDNTDAIVDVLYVFARCNNDASDGIVTGVLGCTCNIL